VKDFFTVLPLAIVMSAGPQIITAVFLATSRDAKRTSLAFLAGVAAATTIGVTVFYFIGDGLKPSDNSGRTWFDWLIVGLLVLLALRVFVKRESAEPPKWMGRLQTADTRFAGKIGLLLYLLMPTDVISMATVGAYLASQDAPWWHSLGFVGLTVLIAGLPLIAVLLLGRRAETLLPTVRTWMSDNSWIVNEAVILFFLAMTLFG
jgi:cytochrome c biogenesis protein CcdA